LEVREEMEKRRKWKKEGNEEREDDYFSLSCESGGLHASEGRSLCRFRRSRGTLPA